MSTDAQQQQATPPPPLGTAAVQQKLQAIQEAVRRAHGETSRYGGSHGVFEKAMREAETLVAEVLAPYRVAEAPATEAAPDPGGKPDDAPESPPPSSPPPSSSAALSSASLSLPTKAP